MVLEFSPVITGVLVGPGAAAISLDLHPSIADTGKSAIYLLRDSLHMNRAVALHAALSASIYLSQTWAVKAPLQGVGRLIADLTDSNRIWCDNCTAFLHSLSPLTDLLTS